MIDILKYIWQLPQNLASIIYYNYLMDEDKVAYKSFYKESKVFGKYTSGSVTLGNHIFISTRASDRTLKHEWGHTRQSLMLGPLYLIVIGIPSILWAATHKWLAPNTPYDSFPTEAWANRLGGVN